MTCKLFVSNFPESYSEESIGLIFSPFGEIKSIKILREPRLFSIVEFQELQDAKAAIDSLNGRKLHSQGLLLHVEMAFERRKRVVVSGIPPDSSKEELQRFFEYYGSVENITHSDAMRTVFIDFSSHEDAESFLELNQKISFGKERDKLSIKPFTKKECKDNTSSPERSLFIYNLPAKITKTDLDGLFARFGEVKSLGVLSGGKAFVNYERELSALKAIRHMDGKNVGGKKIRIILKSMKKGLFRGPI
ncbi:putative polyadenylate-binding-like RNA-binding protein [Encephalitozoon intestinalis ATCC 50506]|uniref:Polyadenylate-binding-like RNA-binding protein n=1 Tax=Encephalitozoon intestinalis (strain ATCC 50506) TaxID=876142 RepID=E0S5N3_ENCIT|nr:putative polyadenylate-binding-like RNA-binding protein [Encephalitozoon intestinalis ATCC 50506]ADM11018.1 putative polyadenylate-binding-like RNA-binding protein [Encephalitozoon intestinalis ATCC 50506]UTX44666.1 polyadenylate-binding protein [Encephalitozoon intestinalis]